MTTSQYCLHYSTACIAAESVVASRFWQRRKALWSLSLAALHNTVAFHWVSACLAFCACSEREVNGKFAQSEAQYPAAVCKPSLLDFQWCGSWSALWPRDRRSTKYSDAPPDLKPADFAYSIVSSFVVSLWYQNRWKAPVPASCFKIGGSSAAGRVLQGIAAWIILAKGRTSGANAEFKPGTFDWWVLQTKL